MFGKSKKPMAGGAVGSDSAGAESAQATPGAPVFTRPDPLGLTGRGTGTSDAGRRAMEAGPRRSEPRSSSTEGRKLVVGREICLSGEIKSCERLVVEGQVEANLTDCQILEISRPGLFRGSAVVEHCDISGTFEGDLTVKGLLIVQGSGRVLGSLRYGELEIERGGVVSGDMALLDDAADEALAERDTAAEPEAFDRSFGGSAFAGSAEEPEDEGDDLSDRPSDEETDEDVRLQAEAEPRRNVV